MLATGGRQFGGRASRTFKEQQSDHDPGADQQGAVMLRGGREGTTPTNAAGLTGLIHNHQMSNPRSSDPGSLGKKLHQHGGVHL